MEPPSKASSWGIPSRGGNGRSSTERPVSASAPQGSGLLPLLWNVFLNDVLQRIPEASPHFDDRTMSFPCKTTTNRRSCASDAPEPRGVAPEVAGDAGPEKTQAVLISRRRDLASLPLLTSSSAAKDCLCRTPARSSRKRLIEA